MMLSFRKVARCVVIAAPLCLILHSNQILHRENPSSFAPFVEWTTTPTTSTTNHQPPEWIVSTQEWASPHFHALYRNHGDQSINKHRRKSLVDLVKESGNIPFYIYPSDALLSNATYHMETLFNNHDLNRQPNVTGDNPPDVQYEINIFKLLWNHSLRVLRSQDAQLFLLPISFATIRYDAELTKQSKRQLITEIWENFKRQEPFLQGKSHVIASMVFELFSVWQGRWWKNEIRQIGLKQFYETISNVSIARGDDLLVTNEIYRRNITPNGQNDFRGFETLFREERTVTDYTFSVGMGALGRQIPLRIPTMETFRNSLYFVFYRTRIEPSAYGSTEYRVAPLVNVTWSSLPLSSVGYPIPSQQWAHDFSNAKFCLVIRGDNPASHALFTSMKAGCIPVLISDWLCFMLLPSQLHWISVISLFRFRKRSL